MDCRNPMTGQNEQRISQVIRIRSCKCSMCLGTAIKPYSYDAIDNNNNNGSTLKTKTRRRSLGK